MRAINVLLSILVSLLIAVGIFEGGLRLLGLGPKTPLVEFDDRLGWAKKPNFEVTRSDEEYSVTIKTNELGLNDDPLEPKGERTRVLALGDSFTQGFSVERGDLFVDLLESWWQNEERPIDVVNAGTEAYDTAQAVAWYLEHGEALEPDVVLLFPYENDLFWNSRDAYASAEGPRAKPRFSAAGALEQETLTAPEPKGFWASSAIGRLFGAGKPAADTSILFRPAGASVDVPKEFGVLLNQEPEFMGAVREHTRGALRALAQACEARGARAVVVPIPARARYDEDFRAVISQQMGGVTDWSPDRPVELFLELSTEAGLTTLDPREALAASTAALGTSSEEDVPDSLYFERDWHFNPSGNRAFASFLHDGLDGLGMLPSATSDAPMPALAATSDTASEGAPFWVKLFAGLWAGLSVLYMTTYRDEAFFLAPIKVGLLLAAVFGIFMGVRHLQGILPAGVSGALVPVLVAGLLGFVIYKLGRRVGTILELLKAFTLRGHWYLMPLVVVLLTIGSLLVVAASSPLIAPFIYTLF